MLHDHDSRVKSFVFIVMLHGTYLVEVNDSSICLFLPDSGTDRRIHSAYLLDKGLDDRHTLHVVGRMLGDLQKLICR